jgi:hypothetical protein
MGAGHFVGCVRALGSRAREVAGVWSAIQTTALGNHMLNASNVRNVRNELDVAKVSAHRSDTEP